MGGGARKRRQQESENQSRQTVEYERQKAGELQRELESRRSLVGEGLPETMSTTRAGATNLRETGGFSPEVINPIRSGYADMAMTGGYSPEDKTSFLRRATAPISAMYSRAKDELGRRLSLQGGYSPGFDASKSRILRQSSQAGADASLNANVALSDSVRSGKVAGLGGLTNIAALEQQGKLAGQDALQRYTQFGLAALSDVDVNQLRNRMQSGQMSQFDSQLLATLAAQDKTTFDKIMQGISVAAGAVSGVAGAFPGTPPTTK